MKTLFIVSCLAASLIAFFLVASATASKEACDCCVDGNMTVHLAVWVGDKVEEKDTIDVKVDCYNSTILDVLLAAQCADPTRFIINYSECENIVYQIYDDAIVPAFNLFWIPYLTNKKPNAKKLTCADVTIPLNTTVDCSETYLTLWLHTYNDFGLTDM